MDSVQDINVSELVILLEDVDNPVCLLDTRTVAEQSQGIIPGALLASPVNMNVAMTTSGVTVVYCRSGIRSAHMCQLLGQQGCENIFNLRHGIIAWSREGLPVIRPEETFFA